MKRKLSASRYGCYTELQPDGRYYRPRQRSSGARTRRSSPVSPIPSERVEPEQQERIETREEPRRSFLHDLDEESKSQWTSDESYHRMINESLNILKGVLMFWQFVTTTRLPKQHYRALFELTKAFLPSTTRHEWQFSDIKKVLGLFHKPKSYTPAQLSERIGQQPSKEKHFVLYDLKEVLQFMYRSPCLLKSLLAHHQQVKNPSLIGDITNGRYHHKVCAAFLSNKENITFTLFVDGVSLYKSGVESFYPAFLVINQLALSERFLPWNIVLVGLISSKIKQNLDTFLGLVANELNSVMSDGWKVTLNGKDYVRHGMLTTVILDLKEQARVLKIIHAGGFWACSHCYIKGVVSRENKKVYYPSESCEMRTNVTWSIDEALSTALPEGAKCVRGIKESSPLSKCKSLLFPVCFPPDPMHCIDLGVVKTITAILFDEMGKQKRLNIDEDIGRIKAPFHFTRNVCSIQHRALWKAQEWKEFALFYCVPLFEGRVTKRKLEHLKLFIQSYTMMNQKILYYSDTFVLDKMLNAFVDLCEPLYGSTLLCTMKLHKLRHVGEAIRDWGKPSEFSAKMFENANGILARQTQGKTRVLSQLSESWMKLSYLPRMIESSTDGFGNYLVDDEWFVDRMKLLGYGPQNKIREHLTNWSTLSANLSYCHTEEEPVSSRVSRYPQLKSYSSSSRYLHRVEWKEVEYRSMYKDTNKRCNSNVLYRLDGDRLVGRIHGFIRDSGDVHVLIERYGPAPNNLFEAISNLSTDVVDVVEIGSLDDICLEVMNGLCPNLSCFIPCNELCLVTNTFVEESQVMIHIEEGNVSDDCLRAIAQNIEHYTF